MRKNIRKVIIYNIPLLLWFFLDMTGFSIGGNLLVSQAYMEDGLFFILYLVSLITFIFFNKIGKIILPTWLSLWLLAQISSHWYFSILGPWENLNAYFSNTIKLFPQTQRYLPDLYHIILHLLIVIALISTLIFLNKSRNKKA